MTKVEADSEAEKVAFDALREMYKKADPGFNFDKVLEDPDEQPDEWYKQHDLEEEKQREIVDKHCEKNDLSQGQRVTVTWIAITDLGPSYPNDQK